MLVPVKSNVIDLHSPRSTLGIVVEGKSVFTTGKQTCDGQIKNQIVWLMKFSAIPQCITILQANSMDGKVIDKHFDVVWLPYHLVGMKILTKVVWHV